LTNAFYGREARGVQNAVFNSSLDNFFGNGSADAQDTLKFVQRSGMNVEKLGGFIGILF